MFHLALFYHFFIVLNHCNRLCSEIFLRVIQELKILVMKIAPKLSVIFLIEKSETSSDGLAPIYMRLTIEGKRREISLGTRINPLHWDIRKGRVSTKSKDAAKVNSILVQTLALIEKHYLLLSVKYKSVSAEMLKKAYQGKFIADNSFEQDVIPGKTILEAFDIYIARYTEKVKCKKRSERTLQKWNTVRIKTKEFLLSVFKQNDLPLKSVKTPYLEDFYHYLITKDKLNHNSAAKYASIIKQLIRFSVGRWIDAYPLISYSCGYISPARTYLTMLELNKIIKQVIGKRLDAVRDCFLFSCFTGLAYEELFSLSPGDIVFDKGKKWMKIKRRKTGSLQDVPLLPLAEDILSKYQNDQECVASNKLLPVISNQKYNQYLKELANVAGIPKGITTHTARHTFATTVTLENGVPIESVSKMLGHKSLRMTQIYAKITRKKLSEDIDVLRDRLFYKNGKLKNTEENISKIKVINSPLRLVHLSL